MTTQKTPYFEPVGAQYWHDVSTGYLAMMMVQCWITVSRAVPASSLHRFNPLTAKLLNLNFHPLEVVSR